jgi:DNA-binding HxlR family transcriptional regulator
MQDVCRTVLNCIRDHDGEWYWYQLDRAIVVPRPELSSHLMPAIGSLQERGLIEIRANPTLGVIPRYWITELGRRYASVTTPIDEFPA